MDVVTALSGSGPAFMAKWVEELEKGGGTGGVGLESSWGVGSEDDVGDGGAFGEGGNEAK